MSKSQQERSTEQPASQPNPSPVEKAAASEEKGPVQAFANAYAAYLRELDDVWFSTKQRCEDAQGRLQEESQREASSEAELATRQEDSMRTYVRALRKTWEESQQRYAAAYQSYLRSLQEAWRSTKPSDLRSQDLSAIGTSMVIAGRYASVTSDRWELLGSYGIAPEVTNLLRYT